MWKLDDMGSGYVALAKQFIIIKLILFLSCRSMRAWNVMKFDLSKKLFLSRGEESGAEFLWEIFMVSLEHLNYPIPTS